MLEKINNLKKIMNKSYYKDELVRIQGRIAWIWAVIHQNNYLIDSYKLSWQDYNVKQYKQENKLLLDEVKELTREYKKTQIILNSPERKVKPKENLIYLNQFWWFKWIKREELTKEMIEREEELGQEMYERMWELKN